MATDDFNRADEALTTPWVKARPAGGNIAIVSNAIRAATDGNKFYYRGDVVAGPDQYAEARIATVGAPDMGPAVRISDVSTTLLNGYFVSFSSTQTQFAKLVDNAYTPIGSALSIGWAVNDVIRLQVEGSLLTVLKNGASVATQTDTAFTDGRVGVAIYNPPGSSGPILDDWAGGALVVAGAEFAAEAVISLSASAALTTAITLAASATLSLTSSAALTTAITLAAAAILRLTAAATLTAGPIVSIPPALRTDVEWFMVRPAVAFRTARTSTAPLILHTTVEQGQ